jgi:fumarate reductase subunit C
VRFIARELTSLVVAYAVGLLLVQVYLAPRPDGYARFVSALRSPPIVAFHVLVLLALLFHTVTWLNLAPRALVVRVAGRRVPAGLVLLGHYAAWVGVSGLLAWVLLA